MANSAFYRALELAQRELAAGTGPPVALAGRAAALVDRLVAGPREPAWACRAGCAHCCSHPVGITFAEAAGLLAAIAVLPGPLRTDLQRGIAAAAAATAAAPWAGLAGTACPLLRAGRCAVYAARPLACRSWGSTDADACARHAAGQTVPLPFDRAAFGSGLGVGAALAETAPALGHRELRSALAALLRAGGGAEGAFAAARPAGADAGGPSPTGAGVAG